MALVNKAWREGEFVPPGAEPGLNLGKPWLNAVEQRAVEQIARQRFAYPTPSDPDLKTYANVPAHTLGVRTESGDMVFPDIVVVDSPTTEVRMVAEVETVRGLLESPDVAEKWRAFTGVGPFYLFVPMALLDVVRAKLKQAGVKPAGLRTWRHMAGMDYTDIVEVRP